MDVLAQKAFITEVVVEGNGTGENENHLMT